jgi:hypothetical protein
MCAVSRSEAMPAAAVSVLTLPRFYWGLRTRSSIHLHFTRTDASCSAKRRRRANGRDGFAFEYVTLTPMIAIGPDAGDCGATMLTPADGSARHALR